jgi:hypothetical protein
MGNYLKTFVLIALMAFCTSCDVLMKTASEMMVGDKPLTTADVATGLKEALRVGVDSSMFHLSKLNGYYLDKVVKINLPPETNMIVEHARRIPGLDTKIEELVVQINRSAEDAAKKAVPVFRDAILSMSIEDAWTILNGADNAATQYLIDKTYNKLVELYRPIMQQSLDKPLVANVSANKTWNEVTSNWNTFATSVPGRLLEVQTVNTQLDQFVTQKALDGAFLKVAEREKLIRTQADARVNEILRRVFGSRQ